MAAEPGTLEGLLAKHGLGEEVKDLLAIAPLLITDIELLANSFSGRDEIKDVLGDKAFFKDRGDRIANMVQCWRAADALVTRGLKRTVENVDNESLEEPLKHDQANILEKAFTAQNRVAVPPLWMG